MGNFSIGDYFKDAGDRPGLGARHLARRARLRPRQAVGDRLRGRRARAGRRGGGRAVARRSACPPSGSCGWAAITSGRPARPAPAARARSSTSTAGRRTAAAGRSALPAATATASSSSGTSFSCSTTCSTTAALEPLPAPSIDTGGGVERIAAAVAGRAQRVRDRRLPRRDQPRSSSGRGARYGVDARQTKALRVLADHGRAMTLPGQRRDRAGQRGPRLRAAAGDPPGDLPRPARSGWSATSRRACTRAWSSCWATCIPS